MLLTAASHCRDGTAQDTVRDRILEAYRGRAVPGPLTASGCDRLKVPPTWAPVRSAVDGQLAPSTQDAAVREWRPIYSGLCQMALAPIGQYLRH